MGLRSVRSCTHHASQKCRKVLGVIGADPQHSASLEMDDDTIPTPQVPDPPALNAEIDPSAINH